ncbi:MAG: imelysin family protein, partial [Bacteroidota bacterium]|nr:imelysin family protein [Bacteroidota bacterium]
MTVSACNPDDDNDGAMPAFDRAAFLENAADNIIVPTYATFAQSTQMLESMLQGLNQGDVTGSDIVALRQGLFDANLAWQRAQIFDFGPASNRALLATTNTFPTDTSEIELATQSDTWQGGLSSTLNSSGLPALDWLLFSKDESSTAAVWNNPASGHLRHAQRLSQYMAEEAVAVLSAWNDSYRGNFVASTGTEAGSSIGELLNAFNRVYEGNIRKQKLGLPNGAMTWSGNPQPSLVEAPFAGDWSIDLLSEGLNACAHLYFGDQANGASSGLGLDDYLTSLGDVSYGQGLHEDIVGQLVSAQAAVATMDDPLAS